MSQRPPSDRAFPSGGLGQRGRGGAGKADDAYGIGAEERAAPRHTVESHPQNALVDREQWPTACCTRQERVAWAASIPGKRVVLRPVDQRLGEREEP